MNKNNPTKITEIYAAPFVNIEDILVEGRIRPLDEHHVKELALSIKKLGLIERPTLAKHGDKYRIVSGFHRIAAMKSLKWGVIPVQFVGDQVGASAMLLANIMKSDMSPMEIARTFKIICKEDDGISEAKIKELAAQLGRSVSTVKDYLKLNDMIGEFQNLAANPKSGFTKEHGLALDSGEKASQIKVFALWKHSPGVSADTVRVWAKNPEKAAQVLGLEPKEVEKKNPVKGNAKKPFHAGTAYQKEIGRLVRRGYSADLVNDTAKAMLPMLEIIVDAVQGKRGANLDTLVQKMIESVKEK